MKSRCSAGGQVGRVGVPEEDVERRRVLAQQVVGDPVVPDQVVRAQPREHARERAAVEVALARGLGDRRAPPCARSMNAPAVPAFALVEHADAERQAGDPVLLARRGEVARRRVDEHDAARAQAQHVRAVGARDRLDRVERLEHRAGVGVEVPVGVALVRVAPGDREHLLALLDRVLDHAAARREVGDVVLVDHRRRRAAAAARAPSACCGSYWISSNTGVRSTTAPGRDRDVLADREGRRVDHRRDARRPATCRARSCAAPRTKLRPPVSSAALSAAGLVSGALVGASASSTFSAAKRTRRSLRQSRPASSISPSTVLPAAR